MRLFQMVLTALTGGMATTPARAEDGESDCGVEIVTPLQIMSWEDFEFGPIAPNPLAASDVGISPAGVVDCDTGATCLAGVRNPGRFKVLGQADAVYVIEVPDEINMIGPGDASMRVRSVSASQETGLLIDGVDEFHVGGVLEIAAAQPPGAYVGQFIVVVNYQ